MGKTMIFRVSRASGLPIDLDGREMDHIAELEHMKQFDALEKYKDELINDEERLSTLMIEVETLEELKLFLRGLEEHRSVININFANNMIEIQDEKVYFI